MIRMERTVSIQRPVDAVFAFITDMSRVRSWLPVSDIRALSNGPMAVGSAFKQTAEFMGRRFDSIIQVTQYHPPHVFAFKMVEGPFPLTNTMSLSSSQEGTTQLTLVGEAEPGSALKFLGPLVAPAVRRQLETQVTRLKQELER